MSGEEQLNEYPVPGPDNKLTRVLSERKHGREEREGRHGVVQEVEEGADGVDDLLERARLHHVRLVKTLQQMKQKQTTCKRHSCKRWKIYTFC